MMRTAQQNRENNSSKKKKLQRPRGNRETLNFSISIFTHEYVCTYIHTYQM